MYRYKKDLWMGSVLCNYLYLQGKEKRWMMYVIVLDFK